MKSNPTGALHPSINAMPIILAGEEGRGLFYASRNFAFEVIFALVCHRPALFREMRSEKSRSKSLHIHHLLHVKLCAKVLGINA